MEELYKKYKEKRFIVLAFPSDQFNQEPLTDKEIKTVYADKFNVNYPIFSKIKVNGANEHPLYTYLKEKQGGLLVKSIKWNYTKFLVNKDGDVVNRYGSKDSIKSIEKDIVKLI